MSRGRRELATDVLHLVTLSGFAVAQPLFGLLASNAEFFVARRSESVDLLALVFVLIALVPLPLVLLELAAAPLGKHPRKLLHGALVALLLSATLLPALKRIEWIGDGPTLLGATALGATGALLVSRLPGMRRYLTFLAPAVLVFPLVFLARPSIRELLVPGAPASGEVPVVEARNPIVMVVFDELPVTALMDDKRGIDAERFPHLAALAASATWYRNATTVADLTQYSLPAIVTGRYPLERQQPTARDHPQNLFRLLAGSYQLRVSESVTMLCPEPLCSREREGFGGRMRSLILDLSIVYLHVVAPDHLASRLPPVTDNWMNFARAAEPMPWDRHRRQARRADRVQQFTRFIAAAEPGPAPGLMFIHVLLPHLPFNYLPSGVVYTDKKDLSGMSNRYEWSWSETEIEEDQQRFLLQVGFVDTLVGRLVERLIAEDLFDTSLVVVTADHGASFRPGDFRRRLTETNFPDILPVPLIIKAPHQRQGRIDDRSFENIDILPTIADLLGLEVPWSMDGSSALDPSTAERRPVVGISTRGNRWRRRLYDPEALDLKYVALESRLARFGSGDSELFWGRGPFAGLVGSRVEALQVAPPSGIEVRLELPSRALRLPPDLQFVPAFFSGRLAGRGLPVRGVHLALAINGVIRAVLPAGDSDRRGDRWAWAAAVPQASFRPGVNRVEVFVLRDEGGRVRLETTATRFADS